ncbi:SDR family NAD(P)-dependent oxidoreductase [Corynebacterium ulceribovis]|uniref:SDR family NAD(P)-dependent oxidoreductase n=1 Tax=Corynebacterium ulceribovis TaxID=487732 RepID=UPI001FE1E34B|nr:SDR family NAD(P)-dependent oxidoreductase [Corynebacterium ulceribovis]
MPMRLPLFHGPALPVVTPPDAAGSPAPRPRVLVTGASSGIGWAAAEQLRDAGYQVIGTSRRGADAPHPKGITMLPLDMEDTDSIEALATKLHSPEALAAHGPLAAIVANAGESQVTSAEDIPLEDLNRLFQVNVLGQILLVKKLLPALREAQRGRIILIGSMLGWLPLPYRATYVSTKAAIRGYGLALRGEVAKFGIGVTVVEPGAIATGLSQRRTIYVPESSAHYAYARTMLENLDANEAKGPPPEVIAELCVREIQAKRPLALASRGSMAPIIGPLARILPTQTTLALIRRFHGLGK